MNHRSALLAATLLVIPIVRTSAAPVAIAATHGAQLSGTVASIEPRTKSFVLASGATNVTVQWTEATRVTGGTLRKGARVVLRTITKSGHTYATTIQVQNSR